MEKEDGPMVSVLLPLNWYSCQMMRQLCLYVCMYICMHIYVDNIYVDNILKISILKISISWQAEALPNHLQTVQVEERELAA